MFLKQKGLRSEFQRLQTAQQLLVIIIAARINCVESVQRWQNSSTRMWDFKKFIVWHKFVTSRRQYNVYIASKKSHVSPSDFQIKYFTSWESKRWNKITCVWKRYFAREMSQEPGEKISRNFIALNHFRADFAWRRKICIQSLLMINAKAPWIVIRPISTQWNTRNVFIQFSLKYSERQGNMLHTSFGVKDHKQS